ncbi:MAG: GTP cyclohydrolase FolE2 [Thermodesulfobacteriota bacterium]
MIDIQKETDHRNVDIDKVGVKNISYPIVVLDKTKGTQSTVAKINMYVGLPHNFKGTHMSRFIEILNEFHGEITIQNFSNILEVMKERLEAASAHMEIEFPYFIEKKAPVSAARSLMEYNCRFAGSLGRKKDFILTIEVSLTTLCPCSREISQQGAHSQRSKATIALRFKKFIWIEDIIRLVESAGSSEIYSLLKRPDEKFVTERAYNNPKFVEDVVRDIAQKLRADKNITWFSVESENLESIHNHNAYALVEKEQSRGQPSKKVSP